jgi:hypothetical protein
MTSAVVGCGTSLERLERGPQGLHCALEVVALNDPGAQSLQVGRPGTSVYLPAEQSVHPSAPINENRPIGHS